MCFLLEHARATKCLYWLDNFKRFQEYTVIYSILHQIHIKWELRMLLQTPENGAGKSVTFCIHEIEYDVLTSISVVRGLLSQLRILASKVRSEILWIVTTEASHHQERQLQGWQLHHPVMFFLDRPPPLAMLPRPCSGASEGSAVCQIFLSWPIKQFQFKISTLPLTQTRGFWWASGAPWFLTRTLPNFYCARLPQFAQVSCASRQTSRVITSPADKWESLDRILW